MSLNYWAYSADTDCLNAVIATHFRLCVRRFYIDVWYLNEMHLLRQWETLNVLVLFYIDLTLNWFLPPIDFCNVIVMIFKYQLTISVDSNIFWHPCECYIIRALRWVCLKWVYCTIGSISCYFFLIEWTRNICIYINKYIQTQIIIKVHILFLSDIYQNQHVSLSLHLNRLIRPFCTKLWHITRRPLL